MKLPQSLYPRRPCGVLEIESHPAFQLRLANYRKCSGKENMVFYGLSEFIRRAKETPARYVDGIEYTAFAGEFADPERANAVGKELDLMNVYRIVTEPGKPAFLKPAGLCGATSERLKNVRTTIFIPAALIDRTKAAADANGTTLSNLTARALLITYNCGDDDPELRDVVMGRDTKPALKIVA